MFNRSYYLANLKDSVDLEMSYQNMIQMGNV